MLVGGVDVSGNPEDGNYKYMSIVIGTDESIRNIMKKLGREQIHMNNIRNRRTQNEIVSKLRFDNKECIGLCYKIDLSNIIKEMRVKYTKLRINQNRIFKAIYYAVWRLIQDPIKEFLQRHHCDIYDVAFQCDSDLREFLKTVGLRHTNEGYAHIVADILAWSNNREQEPEGAVGEDLAPKIKTQLRL